ncbi:MAG: glycyl-radical enzyme activating protein [Clostridiales bacterium]|nr:glycyl-radical enzyme activating protein [Clostridiales bacterium]
MLTGVVFNIQKYSIHDGPGIRTTVFLKGCPLRCQWCHNPEGQSPDPEIALWPSRCLQECQECVSVCDRAALSKNDSVISVDKNKCDLCGECADVCPSRAIEIAGRRLSVGEVMEEVEKDLMFHDESGGGVTYSGGEPLMQPEFLRALLEESKKRGIHTIVDTCGFAQPDVLDKICDSVDLFLYDLKVMDDRKHRRFTGGSNRTVLENLRRLDKKGNDVIVRIPVIPGVNDDEKDIEEMIAFLRSLKNIRFLSLLPYHDLGKEKYKRFALPYIVGNIQPPAGELMEKIKKRLESSGFEVTTGG